MIRPYFKSSDKKFYLLHGDASELLSQFDFKFDMIFADPPYFCQMVAFRAKCKNGKCQHVIGTIQGFEKIMSL